MRWYRLYHRQLKQFQDIYACSAQEACDKVGWLIGDVWVREQSLGAHAPGWRNITPREIKSEEKEG